MDIKDLKKYHTLDITEISASTWNDADVILGLDEEKEVLMAKATDYASEDYVDDAVAGEAALREAADQQLQDAIDHIDVDLSDYYTSGETNQAIQNAIATETARTENTYVKPAALDAYPTQAEVTSEITAATNDMATKTWVGNQGYLTEHQSLAGLFDSVSYVSSSKTINFYDTANTLVGQVDATDFIKDGMVDDVYISGGSLVISFNTDAGRQDISIPLTSIFDPSNYYDKTAIDGMFSAETARTETAYLKPAALNNYYTSAETNNAITAATEGLATEAYVTAATNDMATQTWVGQQGYLTQQSLNGYYTSAQTDAAITAATSGLASETYVTAATEHLVNESALTAYTPTSGFSTINGSAITEGGNIVVQGGGGNVVELTKAEYDALVSPDSATTYIITDAEVVDLNDYALSTAVTAEISAATATKADKANVTARTAPYLPAWNSQGIITGESRYYQVSMSLNGTAQNSIMRTSNSNLTGFYAPTSAGTAGQPLLSNGSGAPVWGGYKFQFISQSQYDALTTPDATTIYFIVDPN